MDYEDAALMRVVREAIEKMLACNLIVSIGPRWVIVYDSTGLNVGEADTNGDWIAALGKATYFARQENKP